MRNTKSVRIILNAFKQTNDALSVVELVKQFSQEMNKTTVYRILERFVEDGILHSFLNKDGLKMYAKCSNCAESNQTVAHPHFQCRQCNRVECLTQEVIIPDIPNRSVDSVDILFFGLCQKCQP